jgi:hypothetical protein
MSPTRENSRIATKRPRTAHDSTNVDQDSHSLWRREFRLQPLGRGSRGLLHIACLFAIRRRWRPSCHAFPGERTPLSDVSRCGNKPHRANASAGDECRHVSNTPSPCRLGPGRDGDTGCSRRIVSWPGALNHHLNEKMLKTFAPAGTLRNRCLLYACLIPCERPETKASLRTLA